MEHPKYGNWDSIIYNNNNNKLEEEEKEKEEIKVKDE